MREGLIVVSFGTAVERARQEEIRPVEEALLSQAPGLYGLTAYTSPTIRRILARRGETVLSLEEAIQAQAEAGTERLYLLPTHLLPGWEYDKISALAAEARERFAQVELAPPLMGDTEFVRLLAQGVAERFPRRPGQAVVLLGHGTDHPGNLVYPAVQGVLHMSGREDMLVGTVEGWPDLDAVLEQLTKRGDSRVLLAPLMLVAGTHALEDMAGPEPDSWKNRLEAAGYTVETVFQGLGALPRVQALYRERLARLLGRG